VAKSILIGVTAVLFVCVAATPPTLAAEGSAKAAIPNFAPDPSVAWTSDRPQSDDFLPPPSGPGPVLSDPAHPYVPNGSGQPTYRIADLTNPILKPWVVERMRKANDEVRAGKVPFIARERCWPAGVPGLDIYNRGQPVHFIQTPKAVIIVNELYAQIRHIYLDVPHSETVKPSWYGESVGRYEGDEFVVDTIGFNDKTLLDDNYSVPHTTELHVIERFKLIEDGKMLQVDFTVDDPGAFKAPWSGTVHYRRAPAAQRLTEQPCAENNINVLGDRNITPTAVKPDF